ncbi:MAG: hypothetical protein M0R03_18240 [Novosphingobium sp.]|nr:hypothetical protein [Novosphingobium sp.]
MTIRFAAARRNESGPVARVLGARVRLQPANDNAWRLTDDAVLEASLRHFGRHGLGAAAAARDAARSALANGDSEAHDWWLSICRAFDRRMADAAARVSGL